MAPELPALGPLLFPGVICSPLVRSPLWVTAPRLFKGTWGLRRPCVALAPASLGLQAEECGSSGSLSSRVLTAKATDRVPGTVAGLRHQVLGGEGPVTRGLGPPVSAHTPARKPGVYRERFLPGRAHEERGGDGGGGGADSGTRLAHAHDSERVFTRGSPVCATHAVHGSCTAQQ